VGLIVGKNGRSIIDIQNSTGAEVSVSPRGEFAPGTSDRIVTIVGAMRSAEAAAKLIQRKIDAATQPQ
jgi:rRNA processing protein Krr1/Pno1